MSLTSDTAPSRIKPNYKLAARCCRYAAPKSPGKRAPREVVPEQPVQDKHPLRVEGGEEVAKKTG